MLRDPEADDLFQPSDEEDIDADGPAVAAEPGVAHSSSGSIGGGGSDSCAESAGPVDPPARAARAGRRRVARAASGLLLFVVLSPGLWPHIIEPDRDEDPVDERLRLWGCMVARWELKSREAEEGSEADMSYRAKAQCRFIPSFGMLFYRLVDCIALRLPGILLDSDDIAPGHLIDAFGGAPATRADHPPGLFRTLYDGLLGDFGDLRPRIIRLSPRWIQQVFGRRHHIFHAVSITSRTDFSRIFGAPSRKEVAAFRKTVGERVANRLAPRDNIRRRKPLAGQYPVEDVISWLRATRKCMNSAELEEASRDWTCAFTRDPEERVLLHQNKIPMGKEVVRKARVRFDCVLMLLTRALFDAMDVGSVATYIFADASPQWRGWELYASSLDIICDEFEERLLMPLVCLSRTMLDSIGTVLGHIYTPRIC